jgi:hypothetical protein
MCTWGMCEMPLPRCMLEDFEAGAGRDFRLDLYTGTAVDGRRAAEPQEWFRTISLVDP